MMVVYNMCVCVCVCVCYLVYIKGRIAILLASG